MIRCNPYGVQACRIPVRWWSGSGQPHAAGMLSLAMFLCVYSTPARVLAQSAPAQAQHGNHNVPRVPAIDGRVQSHWLAGAASGFVLGAGATYILTRQGGSTSLCDRSRNQDALSSGECLGLVVLGGAVGAGIGALIGHAIKSEQNQFSPIRNLQLRAAPVRPGRFEFLLTVRQ